MKIKKGLVKCGKNANADSLERIRPSFFYLPSRKGEVSEIGWTLFVLVTAVFILLIAFIVAVALQFPTPFGRSLSSSSEFTEINNRPYITASVLMHLLAGDRQFIEQAIEIAAAGSVEKANAQHLASYLEDFFAPYENNGNKKFVSVSIKDSDGTNLFSFDNSLRRCGDDPARRGYCINPDVPRPIALGLVGTRIEYSGCPAGQKLIDASLYTQEENNCDSGYICCVEDVDENGVYNEQGLTFCGPKDSSGMSIGICDSRHRHNGFCDPGRILAEDEEGACDDVPCCVPVDSESSTETGIISRAEVPLVFNDTLASIEVTTR